MTKRFGRLIDWLGLRREQEEGVGLEIALAYPSGYEFEADYERGVTIERHGERTKEEHRPEWTVHMELERGALLRCIQKWGNGEHCTYQFFWVGGWAPSPSERHQRYYPTPPRR